MGRDELKQLIIDLSGRVPYHVVVRCTDDDDPEVGFESILTFDMLQGLNVHTNFYQYKPYLRPMTSMSEEEKKKFADLLFSDLEGGVREDFYKSIDYLNSIHIDYRGFIDKGWAIAVDDKGFNPYKRV